MNKHGICQKCLQEIKINNIIKTETPLFYKTIPYEKDDYINGCVFHYVLNVKEPPIFLPLNFEIALQIFQYYVINGYVEKNDFKYYFLALKNLKK